MEDWDEEKLRNVVLSKAGNPRTTTDVFSFSYYLHFSNLSNIRSYANISLTLLNLRSTVGFGNVQTVWIISIGLIVSKALINKIGDNCQYRHALPPGFVLKSEKKAREEAEKANTISLEEFLETEVRILLLNFLDLNKFSGSTSDTNWGRT